MRKLIVVTDILIDQNKLSEESVKNVFESLKEYDVETIIVESPKMSMEEFSEYASTMEKNGVEELEDNPVLVKEVADAEYLITHFSPISSRIIEAGENLKFIGVARSGCENICLKAATEKGIKVAVAAGRLADPVADYTVGILLAECRNISRLSLKTNDGKWTGEKPDNFKYVKCLRNKWVGIIGLGVIGKNVAERLRGFGVRLMAYDPFCPDSDFEKYDCKKVDLPELMKTADFVCIHARLTPETKGMVTKELINLMKPSAFIVNTARADLVDEAALIQALKEHKIAGAALDVFSEEPLSENHELRGFDNVTLTPHIAGGTSDQAEISFRIVTEDLKRYLRCEKLINERVFRG